MRCRRARPRALGSSVSLSIERRLDPDTGDGVETLLAGFGIVPPGFLEATNWPVALNCTRQATHPKMRFSRDRARAL